MQASALADFLSIPRLLVRSVRLLAKSILALLAWAFAGLGAVLACLSLTPLLGPLVLGPLAVLFVAAHSLFAVYASRRIAREIDPTLVEPIAFAHWVGATTAVALVTTAIAAPFALALPSLLMSAIVLAIVLASTPLLPELALRPGNLGDIVKDAGRYPLRFFPIAAILALPYLALAELVGWPALSGHVGWGLFEGGIVLWPFLGAHTFIATTSAALVSTVVYAALRDRRAERTSYTKAIGFVLVAIVLCAAGSYALTRPPDQRAFTMLGTWQSNDRFTIVLRPNHTYRFCDGAECSEGSFDGPGDPHGITVVLHGLFDKPNARRFLLALGNFGGQWGAHGYIADFEFSVNSGLGGAAPTARCDDEPCVFYGDYDSGPYLAFTKTN